jgi:hypothetical protein
MDADRDTTHRKIERRSASLVGLEPPWDKRVEELEN